LQLRSYASGMKNFFLDKVFVGACALVVAGAAVAAAWAIAAYPPPETFAKLTAVRNPSVREAQWWRTSCAGVQCTLCPWKCFLPEGARGRCRVRMNSGGQLLTLVYQNPVSVHLDPIEKKPVFHLLPGSLIYSLATVGCNLTCTFCQNWEISQIYPEQAQGKTIVPKALRVIDTGGGRLSAEVEQGEVETLSPEEVVKAALATRCRSVAYTYSEPAVYFEYVLETAKLAKKKGLKNVLVSGGYIEPGPLAELAPYFDVVKIDLKGFNENFYRKTVGGELKFVLRTLRELKAHHVLTEVVNLVVPTMNDDEVELKSMAKWIKENLGPDTPLFFSRFSPQYRLQNLPATPVETLEKAARFAKGEGLRYVYIGNVPGHPLESTYCPVCGQVLIKRYGYRILEYKLDKDGRCPRDGTKIPGIWE